MQLDTGDRSTLQAEINITPLVDVVLVLLIIFMVVVPLMMEGYDVNIPKTSAAAGPSPALNEDAQLVLSVAPGNCPILSPPAGERLPANCDVMLADQKIPVSELPQRVANILGVRPPEKRVLFLSADDRMNYEGLLRILDLAKSNVGDLKVEFLTTQ